MDSWSSGILHCYSIWLKLRLRCIRQVAAPCLAEVWELWSLWVVGVLVVVSDAPGRPVTVDLSEEQTAGRIHQSPSTGLFTRARDFTRVCCIVVSNFYTEFFTKKPRFSNQKNPDLVEEKPDMVTPVIVTRIIWERWLESLNLFFWTTVIVSPISFVIVLPLLNR